MNCLEEDKEWSLEHPLPSEPALESVWVMLPWYASANQCCCVDCLLYEVPYGKSSVVRVCQHPVLETLRPNIHCGVGGRQSQHLSHRCYPSALKLSLLRSCNQVARLSYPSRKTWPKSQEFVKPRLQRSVDEAVFMARQSYESQCYESTR